MTGVITAGRGSPFRVTAAFTRPSDTTAYAANDLVANNTTAGSVTPLSWAVGRDDGSPAIIRRAGISFNDSTLTNAQFRLHLFVSSPTVTNGDNGAFTSDNATWLGAIDITVGQAHTKTTAGATGYGVPNVGGEIIAVPATSSRLIYGLLEALAAYTPTSAEVFTVSLAGFRD